jgi:hypothetical protein
VDENGYIENVWMDTPGATLEVDAGIGAGALEVSEAYDFEETGGQLSLNGVVYTYTTYDDETSIITLSGTLSAAAVAGDRVFVYPFGEAMYASVNLDDGEEPIRALVPFEARERFVLGIRDDADMESVTVSDDSGRWVITEVDEEPLLMDLEWADPDTVPPSANVPVTVSPTPVVIGGIRQLNVQWPPTDGTGVTVQVHISETSGFTPVLDGPTLAGESQGTGFVIERMPDGLPLQVTYDHDADPDTGEIPKIYYVKTIAYNDLSTAPVSAQGSGSLRQIDSPDVNVNAVWAGFVYADRMMGGNVDVIMNLTAGGEIAANGAGGEKVSLSGTDGFQVIGPTSLGNPTYVSFPVDGRPNIIGGILNANTLTVEGDSITGQAATFRRNSQVENGATFTLNDSVMSPLSGPVLESVIDETLNATATLATDVNKMGSGVWFSGEYYWVEHALSPRANRVYKWNPGTNVITDLASVGYGVRTDLFAYGLTKVGSGSNGWRILWAQIPGQAGVSSSADPELFLSSHADSTFTNLSGVSIGTIPNETQWAHGFGTDGTDMWVATLDHNVTSTTATLRFRKFPAALSGTPTETVNTTFGYDIIPPIITWKFRSLCVGNFDLGARKFIVSEGYSSNSDFDVFSTTGAREVQHDWGQMKQGVGSALSWDGTRFWDMCYNGSTSRLMHKYTTMVLASQTTTIYGNYTFYTSTGPKETVSSPQVVTSLHSRWKWKMTITTPPSGLAARVYLGTASGTTNSKLQATLSTGVTAHTSDAYNASGAAPPTTSTFGSATPARIESQQTTNVVVSAVSRSTSSTTLTGTNKFRPWMVGQTVTGTFIPANTTIVSVDASRDSAVMSQAATLGITDTITFPNQPKLMLRGDGAARIYEVDELIIGGNDDATSNSGNTPPLRIGDVGGSHLRIDDNELIAMSSDTVKGNYTITAQDVLLRPVDGSLNIVGSANFRGKIRTEFEANGTAIVFLDERVVIGNAAWNASGGASASNTQALDAASYRSWGTSGYTDENFSGGGSTGANINNSGKIVRAASARSAKEDIRPLLLNQAKRVMDLEEYLFRYKEEMELGDELRAGFMADQAVQVGLDILVARDAAGNPVDFKDGSLLAAHNLLLKDLYQRVTALEGT